MEKDCNVSRVILSKDGGARIYGIRNKDFKRMRSFYPNVSIIRISIEEDIH